MERINGSETSKTCHDEPCYPMRPESERKSRLDKLKSKNTVTLLELVDAFVELPNEHSKNTPNTTICSTILTQPMIAMVRLETLLVNAQAARIYANDLNRMLAYNSKIANDIKFVSEMAGCIHVGETDKGYYIIDGTHRAILAYIFGQTVLPAIIHRKISVESCVKIGLDRHTTMAPIKAIQKFRAELMIKDSTATCVKQIADRYGLEISERPSAKTTTDCSRLTAISTARGIVEKHNDHGWCLDWILGILHEAKWTKDPNGTNNAILAGLEQVYTLGKQDGVATIYHERLVNVLRMLPPEQFMKIGNIRYNRDDKHNTNCMLTDIIYEHITPSTIADLAIVDNID